MSRSENIGVVKKHIPSTRVMQQPGGKQSFNIFSTDASAVLTDRTNLTNEPTTVNEGINKSTNIRVAAPPGGRDSVSSLFNYDDNVKQQQQQAALTREGRSASRSSLTDENARNEGQGMKVSTRVSQLPGGSSSMGSILSFDAAKDTSAPINSARRPSAQQASSNIFATETDANNFKSSVRVANVPGGRSAMSDILSGQNKTADNTSTRPVSATMKSSIFSDEAAPVKSSTRVIAAPGGNNKNGIANIMSFQAEPEQVQTFKTAKTNSSQHVLNLTPKADKAITNRSSRKNESHNVLNLTPTADDRSTQRSYRTNEESQEQPEVIPVGRYQAHNNMMKSNVFNAAPQTNTQSSRSSTRVHCPPGGKSSNIFSS